MKTLGFLVALLAATLPMQINAEPMLLSLNAEQLRDLELDSIPAWPDEIVLSGTNKHWQKVLHTGEVTLTPIDGEEQTYRVGDNFTVPKGWMGTWHMPVKFREMIVVETRAWVASEE